MGKQRLPEIHRRSRGIVRRHWTTCCASALRRSRIRRRCDSPPARVGPCWLSPCCPWSDFGCESAGSGSLECSTSHWAGIRRLLGADDRGWVGCMATRPLRQEVKTLNFDVWCVIRPNDANSAVLLLLAERLGKSQLNASWIMTVALM